MALTAPLEQLLNEEIGLLERPLGWHAEPHYGDPVAEYRAMSERAGLVNASLRTQIEVSGDDRLAFLNRLATNKLIDLKPGAGCETFFTNARGHVVAHADVYVGTQSVVLVTVGGQTERLLHHLDYYLVREKVRLTSLHAQEGLLLVLGPDSARVLSTLHPAALPTEPHQHVESSLADRPVLIRRAAFPASEGYWLALKGDDLNRVERAVTAAGAMRCGWLAVETQRIESGMPEYGRDITDDHLPQETGRDRQAVSYSKGCYLGQETVARLASRGHVNRRLVGLKFEAVNIPPAGLELTVKGERKARVTSAALSPLIEAALALGYARRGFDAPGSQFESPYGPAEVIELPLRRPARNNES